MNLLDLLIILVALAAAIGGYRLGFLARVLSWAGLAGGLALAVAFLPDVVHAIGDADPRTRFLAAIAYLLGASLIGQAVGYGIGSVLHGRLRLAPGMRQGDHVAGAVLGVVGIFVVVWLLLPAIASAPGWTTRAARNSAIVAAVHDLAPTPPKSLEELGREVGSVGPSVLSQLDSPPKAGAPPVTTLSAATDARVRASTVKVEGRACDTIQSGSGFVVSPGVVVTNAHVVAGERRTTVDTSSGARLAAQVVIFDPRRDLALLRVSAPGLAPLALTGASRGTVGAVYGHPGGGPLAVSPARVAEEITAEGTDIYRTTGTSRDVFVLAAQLAPGDSGGPFVDGQGRVAGVAFAIDPGQASTAYALTDAELRPVLDRLPTSRVPVPTGSCLAG